MKIGIIGDYDGKKRSHVATNAALDHTAQVLGLAIDYEWVPTPSLEGNVAGRLAQFDALFCSPGSPYDSMEGALNGIRYARERDIVFMGT